MSADVIYETFARKWFYSPLPVTNLDLTGRTVIVTGANGGLGFEAAKHFYSMNPERLILAVRNPSKGLEAKQEILQSSESKTIIDVWELDLASFESVKKFAQRALNELDRLDVLLENAAIVTEKWATTEDGWEVSLQTNVLSTFLLAALLVPLVKKTASLAPPVSSTHLRPHVVIATSDVHTVVKFNERSAANIFGTLNDEKKFVGSDRYHTTKLFDILLARQLTKSLELNDQPVTVCSVNPGFSKTELMREFSWAFRQTMYALLSLTAEEGSRNYLWACLSNDIPPGSYCSGCSIWKPLALVGSAEGDEIQKRIWKEMSEILVKVAPETAPVWKVVD